MSNTFNPAVIQKLKDAIEKAVEETAVAVQAEAREIVPQDTGHLQKSIQVEKVGQYEVRVTANTDYALYVHEGWTDRGGQYHGGTPYLLKPLQDEKDNLNKRVIENL